MLKNRLCIVVPCYNEEDGIQHTNYALLELLNNLVSKNKIAQDSVIMYVDDGSTDDTWNILSKIHEENIQKIKCIKLSKNCGHQNALYAGLMEAKNNSDITISIDADLQDDLFVIESFIEKYNNGCDIVFGVRRERKTDSFFKRTTALAFYKIMNGLGVNIVYNHADFRLMSRRALEGLSKFTEANLFLRGIVTQIGYKTDVVYYDRLERMAGYSKYNFGKMIFLAINGITSFSLLPLRIASWSGLISVIISLIYGIFIIVEKYKGHTINGWSSVIISIWFLGGVQMFSLGIIGEYIGKIYLETKQRPKYIIEHILDSNTMNFNKRH